MYSGTRVCRQLILPRHLHGNGSGSTDSRYLMVIGEIKGTLTLTGHIQALSIPYISTWFCASQSRKLFEIVQHKAGGSIFDNSISMALILAGKTHAVLLLKMMYRHNVKYENISEDLSNNRIRIPCWSRKLRRTCTESEQFVIIDWPQTQPSLQPLKLFMRVSATHSCFVSCQADLRWLH